MKCHKLNFYKFQELDVESLCHECGLEIRTDSDGCIVLPTKQTNFHSPKEGFKNYDLTGIEIERLL